MKKNILIDKKEKLCNIYGYQKGNKIFEFYYNIIRYGLINTKFKMNKEEYYNNLKYLKKAKINYLEKIDIDYYIKDYIINFNSKKHIKWTEVY